LGQYQTPHQWIGFLDDLGFDFAPFGRKGFVTCVSVLVRLRWQSRTRDNWELKRLFMVRVNEEYIFVCEDIVEFGPYFRLDSAC
jgi:hypothetical protein